MPRVVGTDCAILLWALAPAMLLAPTASAAEVSVAGTVFQSGRDGLIPLASAKVRALPPDERDILGVALTDAAGRYSLRRLPSQRVVLTASRVGYFTERAGAHEGSEIVLDCSQAADCEAVDFVMLPAGVAAGRVVDEFGDPLQAVLVQPRDVENSGATDTRLAGRPSSTDDLGRFRIYNLSPGRYRLETEILNPNADPRRQAEPIEVEVESGSQIAGLEIMLTRRPFTSFRVSGKVQGIDFTRSGVHFINVRPAPGSRGSRARFAVSRGQSVGPDGSFTFQDLSLGKYTFSYIHRSNAYGEGRRPVILGTVDVNSDLTGLILCPLDQAGVRGSVAFESRPPSSPVTVWFVSQDIPQRAASVNAQPTNYHFEVTNLLPGAYQVAIAPQSRDEHYYLKGIRRGSDIDTSRTIVLTAGVTELLELVAADNFSRVSGRVKASPVGQLSEVRVGAQFWVALKGPGRVRSTQTDQHGHFFFDNVGPGEYQIGAWQHLSPQAARDDAFWEERKEVLRRFVVEPDNDIEIDLTAAP